MSRIKQLIFLVLWTILAGGVYWGFGETPYTLTVTLIYCILCVMFFLFYVFVNGGVNPVWKKPSDGVPNANPLRLPPEKQERFARVFLILGFPLFVILAADYIILHWFY